MRWIRVFAAVGLVAAGMFVVPAVPAPEEKRLSIYSPVANYALNVTERNGQDYVGLVEILEPLGQVTAKTDGQKWKLRFNKKDADFKANNPTARVQGKPIDLTKNFVLENGRGLVPLNSLTTLLPSFLGIPVIFHVTARRLFIGQAATHYSAEFNKAQPKLVLNFTSAVNPTIATEPGKVRMSFVRDPLLPSGPETTDFDSKVISSTTYQENNGAAELTINGSVPLLASFSNNGRTITIAPAPSSVPAPAASTASPATPAPGASTLPLITASPSPEGPPPAPIRRVFAVLDASHGGDDRGAAIGQFAEKDVTIAFARRIREELQNRGIPALVLRDSDATLSLDQRASLANGTRSQIYLAVHASSEGLGVRVFTALMPAGGANSGPFLAWDNAQLQFLPAAQSAAQSLAAELRKKLPVRMASAPMRPLNNLTMPALALEVATQTGDTAELTSPVYQQLVASAVADGIVAARDKLGAPH